MKMNQSVESSSSLSKRTNLWFKAYLVLMMCFAGSLIYMVFYVRGIRGLDWTMWYLVGICLLTIAICVYYWPKVHPEVKRLRAEYRNLCRQQREIKQLQRDLR